MLLNKERCSKCRSERSVRKCPRLRNKFIGWKCCNTLRVDLRCPAECPYAATTDEKHISPFPAFRADSNTEFVLVTKRFIDFWSYLSQANLENKSPAEYAKQESDKMLAWLAKYQYPANFPVAYLMQKLELKHDIQAEPETPETVAFAFMDAVIAQEWKTLRNYTGNDSTLPELVRRYEILLSNCPALQKAKNYDILHAGAADDGVSAVVVLEINHKLIWTLLLSSAGGKWQIKQNLNGSPHLYYAQNQLFRKLAEALANAREQETWDLLNQNLPLYPDCADLYYYRALYWQLAKQTDKAKEDFLNSLALDNHFFEAGFTLSVLYLNEKELLPALDILKLLQADRPDDLNIQNNIAACEAGLGNIDKAVDIWNSILESAPNYEPAKKNLERQKN